LRRYVIYAISVPTDFRGRLVALHPEKANANAHQLKMCFWKENASL